MTRLEFTLRELGHLYDFYKAIQPYRITSAPNPAIAKDRGNDTIFDVPPPASSVLQETPQSPEPKFDTPPQPR